MTTHKSSLVLAIDSDTAALDLIRRELRREGFRVITERTGNSALRTAEQQQPDLVLLSVTLPDMPGLEVLRRIRARSATPVILLASGRGAGARPPSRGRGVEGVLA